MSRPSDKSDIEAAARRALIAVDPAYHSWSNEQQEIFHATMDDDVRYHRIRHSLLASLRGIECDSEKKETLLQINKGGACVRTNRSLWRTTDSV